MDFTSAISRASANMLRKSKENFAQERGLFAILKKAGIPQEDLVKLYKVLVRPVLDYCSSVYHTLPTAQQSESLEWLQRNTLKSIYGFEKSYNELLETSGIERLCDRRSRMFDKFILQSAENQRFTDWFPRQESTGYDLRKESFFKEKFASMDRLRNCPLYAARRRLNELYIRKNLWFAGCEFSCLVYFKLTLSFSMTCIILIISCVELFKKIFDFNEANDASEIDTSPVQTREPGPMKIQRTLRTSAPFRKVPHLEDKAYKKLIKISCWAFFRLLFVLM